MCLFYNNYVPWFESNIKHFRRLQRLYHRQVLPLLAWSPQLIDVFKNCKPNLVTSPLLLRYDSSKPTFLKTDWSTGGMGYIFMQPGNSPIAIAAIELLQSTDEFIFDQTLSGPRLTPVLFNSRSNLVHEKYYHSFVSEIAYGRWSISCLRKYLWGTLFYWMCDCNAIKEIIENDDSIHQLKRWTQEFLAYEFVIIYRVASMMKNVDSISRYVNPLVHQYNMTAIRLHSKDFTKRPFAYCFDVFTRCTNPGHVTASDTLSISITTTSITSFSALYHSPIKFSPVFSISIHFSILLSNHSYHVSSFVIIPSWHITWISFDSIINSFLSILYTQGYNTFQYFICESNPLHFSIANTLSSYSFIFYNTFQQCITYL